MTTKNKLRIGFGTLAVATFVTLGANNASADFGNKCKINNKVTCDTVTVGETTYDIKGEVIKDPVIETIQ